MRFLQWIWWELLAIPVRLILRVVPDLELSEESIFFHLAKVAVLLVALYVFSSIAGRVKRRYRRIRRKDSLIEPEEAVALRVKRMQTPPSQEPSPSPPLGKGPPNHTDENTLRGQTYVSMSKFKEAARSFKKAGDHRRAATCLAQAGRPLKAAKLLMQEGDFVTAGRYYTEAGKTGLAAKAYERSGDLAAAAAAYARGNRFDEAIAMYNEYFADPTDPVAEQGAVAEACYKMLEEGAKKGKVRQEARQELLRPLAERFEHTNQYGLAGRLYREMGSFAHAGEVFVLAGKLEDAADCMRKAGREHEASRITGRYFESKRQWKDAARAYLAAGDFPRAGQCFSQGADPVRAAESFERAEDFYRAGLGYAHAARFKDAIPVLQRMRESDDNFEESRALLGRCFFELHEYPDCAAALDNHLMGKRVTSNNADYFYMLALAYEQIGRLDESRDILYKIRSVDTSYRDVTQRISSLDARISTAQESRGAASPEAMRERPTVVAGMQSVENTLQGRYKLERELGRGGMGVVYLARDTQLDRPVALKFLGNLVDNSEQYRERFVREARTAARISHPNIVSIYDISASEGRAYIAMEYVEGLSLFRYVQSKGHLQPKEAINLICQALSALAAVHEAGITHRDIKPDNILLSKGGLVKVMDFGLAKAEDSRMTRTGVVMGTPSYMSPEQVLGKEADARSDLYSLGLVLHECLTGNTVFMEGDILERQLEEMPESPGAVVDGVPSELDEIVMRCVAKKPEQRYQTAKELIADLRKVRTT